MMSFLLLKTFSDHSLFQKYGEIKYPISENCKKSFKNIDKFQVQEKLNAVKNAGKTSRLIEKLHDNNCFLLQFRKKQIEV